MLLLGIIEDSLGLQILHWIRVELGYTTEPLFYNLFFFFSSYINTIYLYNIFVVLSFVLGILSSFWLFYKIFKFQLLISILASINLILSPYMIYQSQSHLVLIQVWLLLLFIGFFLKNFLEEEGFKYKNFFFTGLVLGVVALTSNYLGFFSLLFSTLYFACNFLLRSRFKKNVLILYIKHAFVFYLSFVFLFLFFNFNFINQAFFDSSNQTLSVNPVFSRSIEDFFIFSSRPWYYLIPSVDNPFFGDFSQSFISFLQNGWGNFLADNYFKSEHSASFLGLVNLFLGILGLYGLYFKNNFSKEISTKDNLNLITLFFVFIILVLFSMPPFLTISDWKVYFPSYFISEFFSMFRVLSRLGILTLTVWLVFVSLGYSFILSYFKKRLFFGFSSGFFLILLLFCISIMEFFVPFRFTNISQTPQVYQSLRQNYSENTKFIVYPHSKTREGEFWSKDHKLNLLNKYGFEREIGGKRVSSAVYTESFTSCQGLGNAREDGAKILVYFPNEDGGKGWEIFSNLELISKFEKISQPESSDYFLYQIKNTGEIKSNVAFVYNLENFHSRVNCDASY